MKKLCFIFLLFFLVLRMYASPMHTHYKHSIIIDTDCAIDDMRAIAMLLSLSNVTVKAIMVSDGSLPPQEGVLKVKSLLREFNKDSIPVFQGIENTAINPVWRDYNRKLKWANYNASNNETCNLDSIAKIIEKSPKQISLVCLGPLTNSVALLSNFKIIEKNIEEVIWYTESANPFKGFNYECDQKAAEALTRMNVKTYVVSNLDNPLAVFDTAFFNLCKKTDTPLAKLLLYVHSQPEVNKKLHENHFRLWDELVVTFLTNRELYRIEPFPGNTGLRYVTGYSAGAVREVMEDIIKNIYRPGEYVALYGFPVQRDMYYYDIRLIMDWALLRYGLAEWKACVLTDEFHGHLGVYSIVGAKMGMRARDYFGIGTDLMTVVSYAGSKPPFSCMNDGIQVSTGATLGQGTITVAPDSITKPVSIFTYNNTTIKITLKKPYLELVRADIKAGLNNYGLADEAYWSFIRQNALKYWLEWDRKEIFEVEVIK